jgi:hypothetical protein
MPTKNLLCKIFGHRWIHKDYSNHIKSDGSCYEFTVLRKCIRCDAHAYLYDSWKTETTESDNGISNFQLQKKASANEIT